MLTLIPNHQSSGVNNNKTLNSKNAKFSSLALSWARMSVKPSKSKSLVIDSGKIVHDKSL